MITLFPNIIDTLTNRIIPIETAVERTKLGTFSKEKVERIRSAKTKEERDKIKATLPCFVFQGEFTIEVGDEEKRSLRRKESCAKHSGYICLDFDHVGTNGEVLKKKEEFCKDKYTCICFISPSGDGIKVVVKIPDEILEHERRAEALHDYFKESSLDRLKDISRLCFQSYDPDIYYNPDSEIFTEIAEEKKYEPQPINVENKITNHDDIYKILKTWAEDRTEGFVDGNRQNFIVKLSGACNRMGIPKDVTLSKLLIDYSQIGGNSPFTPKEFEATVNKIYTTYSSQFGDSMIKDKLSIKLVDNTDNSDAIFDTKDITDVILVEDIREQMLDAFRNGFTKGETTYFPSIDPLWTWQRGEVTVMSGIANHGKSQMMLQLMLIKSIKEGTKWAVFSPEQNPPIYFYNDLIHTYIGKNTEKFYMDQMNEAEYNFGMDFINKHFFFIYPETESPTPDYINNRFEELIIKHGVDGCIIDPFNQLDNDWTKHKRDDRYISDFLNKEKRFALKHNIYKLIVCHPNSGIEKKDGNREAPDVFDLAGGIMWANKLDNVLCYHRPYFSTDRTNTECRIISQKIKKQKLIGMPGETTLFFNRKTNRYYDFFDKSPFDNIFGVQQEALELEVKETTELVDELKYNPDRSHSSNIGNDPF